LRDTASTALDVQADAIRRLEPVQRLRQALELSEWARALSLSRLRTLHPDLTELELVEVLIDASLIPTRRSDPAG
jgi:hypothetical protein